MTSAKTVAPPRGMRDFLPQEVLRRQLVMEKIETVFRRAAFVPIDTPALEELGTLLGGHGGEENEKLLYRVLKRGEPLAAALASGEELADLGLRFDLTVPLCRYYATHRAALPHPFRRYHFGKVYRAERPARGRFREFFQCDVDIIGSRSPLVELEVMTTVEAALDSLGFRNFLIRLNSRDLLGDLLKKFNIDPKMEQKVFITLDKLDKLPLPTLLQELADLGCPEPFRNWVAELHPLPLRERSEPYRRLFSGSPHLELLDLLCRHAGALGQNLVIDPFLIRGMGYYTGPIFEISQEGESFSLAGGGRYDQLVGRFLGEEVPACGFSIGFERILTLLEERKIEGDLHPPPRVFIPDLGEESTGFRLALARHLRRKGAIVELALEPRKIGKQLETAVRDGANWAILLGPDELSRGQLMLKDLRKREQRPIELGFPLVDPAKFLAMLESLSPLSCIFSGGTP